MAVAVFIQYPEAAENRQRGRQHISSRYHRENDEEQHDVESTAAACLLLVCYTGRRNVGKPRRAGTIPELVRAQFESNEVQ